MRTETEFVVDTAIVTVFDARLDGPRGAELLELIKGLFRGGYRSLIVDLAAVRAIDSTGLGALVSALKFIGAQGELSLCGISEPVGVLFRLTRMDRVFRFFKSRDDALSSCPADH